MSQARPWASLKLVGGFKKKQPRDNPNSTTRDTSKDNKTQQCDRSRRVRKRRRRRELRTLEAGNDTGSYENRFILRSWSGQALSLLESSRISSDVTCPGLPRVALSAG